MSTGLDLKPSQPTLITLDVGDTLGRSTAPSLTSQLAKLSPFPESEVKNIIRQRSLIDPNVTEEIVAALCAELRVDWSKWPHESLTAPFHVFPETPSSVRDLATLAPVATFSNTLAWHAHHHTTLREACAPHIIALHNSCDIRFAKPDPRAFHAVAKYHGGSVSSLVHVGDLVDADVLGALDAGARAVWISHGRPTPDVIANVPDSRLLIARDIAMVAALISVWF